LLLVTLRIIIGSQDAEANEKRRKVMVPNAKYEKLVSVLREELYCRGHWWQKDMYQAMKAGRSLGDSYIVAAESCRLYDIIKSAGCDDLDKFKPPVWDHFKECLEKLLADSENRFWSIEKEYQRRYPEDGIAPIAFASIYKGCRLD